MSKQVLKCNDCAWEFKQMHSSKCPQCGTYNTVLSGDNEVFNHGWIKRQQELAIDNIRRKAKEVQCCHTSKHTRGFHHDSNCPEQPEVY